MKQLLVTRKSFERLIRGALAEDRAAADATSRILLPSSARLRARLIAKAPGVLAGGTYAAWTFQALDPTLRCVVRCREGSRLRPGQLILTVEGRARSILAAERTALNLLGHLCGVATMTRAFVRYALGAQIFDTRKTLPGLRALEKYAVRVGGGHHHRSNLQEAILIKTNHLRALSGQWSVTSGQVIREAIANAKRVKPKRFVEIEVTNLREFKVALDAAPDAILLDNWPLRNIHRAMTLRNASRVTGHSPLMLEVSGGVTLGNVGIIARLGVDRISVGRLTHSAPALDCSLQVVS